MFQNQKTLDSVVVFVYLHDQYGVVQIVKGIEGNGHGADHFYGPAANGGAIGIQFIFVQLQVVHEIAEVHIAGAFKTIFGDLLPVIDDIVIFIPDIANQLLQNILHGNDAFDTAVFTGDHYHMGSVGTEFVHDLMQPHGFGDENGIQQKFLKICGFVFRQFLMDTMQGVGGNWKTILLIAAAGFAVYYLMSILVNILILTLVPDFSNINDGSISEIGKKSRLLTAMGTVILVPTAEELLHRGAVFGSFYGKNRLAAYGISTVVFALVHISGYIGYHPAHILALCFLQYIPAGICLAASYEFSGNILTPILIHTAVNTVGILAMR